MVKMKGSSPRLGCWSERYPRDSIEMRDPQEAVDIIFDRFQFCSKHITMKFGIAADDEVMQSV
jgi:hypothetical protein